MRRPALLLAAAIAACAPGAAHGPRSDGLYRAMRACLADPEGPSCTFVDPGLGFVVIKDDDPAKPAAWLLVPSTDVTGIEDPAVFQAPVALFWQIGWEAGRDLVPAFRDGLGLAINSKAGRSQNLLHIHISCLRPDVRAAIAAADIGPDWADAPFLPLAGQTFNARRVPRLEPSPFLLLRDLPGAAEEMANQSLAVVGHPGGGYVLLTDSTEPGVVAETEAILDETCAGRSPAPAPA
jgi:CDP-diacylglycerol pyrophosphatase